MTTEKIWTKKGWKEFPAMQQPNWPDPAAYQAAVDAIGTMPPLVFAGEIRTLRALLADAARGEAFLLQGGDCAEDFARCTAPAIRETLKVILQMAVVLTYAGGKPVAKVGRIAGQYAKPRSSDTERVNGIEIPSYRGDMVNSMEPVPAARQPDPRRMVEGYFRAAATMNILRAFTRGGYAALHRVQHWNNVFVANSPMGKSYEKLAGQIEAAIHFMRTIGIDTNTPQINQVNFYTSHEALLLGYEEALTRQDSTTGTWYDCSAHMLWIGDRTRQANGAHAEFLRGVHNPIGIKVGPAHDPAEILTLLEILNKDNEPGRITLITRFGRDRIEKILPPLIKAVQKEGQQVLWCCDPMHANTVSVASGKKTRRFDDIMAELVAFFQIHWAQGTVPGGIHFELTGDNVTECVGGGRQLSEEDLHLNYQTNCDPRLNAEQSLDIAFRLAELIRG